VVKIVDFVHRRDQFLHALSGLVGAGIWHSTRPLADNPGARPNCPVQARTTDETSAPPGKQNDKDNLP
jgi:hypothetical protein